MFVRYAGAIAQCRDSPQERRIVVMLGRPPCVAPPPSGATASPSVVECVGDSSACPHRLVASQWPQVQHVALAALERCHARSLHYRGLCRDMNSMFGEPDFNRELCACGLAPALCLLVFLHLQLWRSHARTSPLKSQHAEHAAVSLNRGH